MADLMTADKVRKAAQVAAEESRRLKVDADRMRDEMIAAGVDLTDLKSAEFTRLDDAYKAVDLKADEATELAARARRMESWDGRGDHDDSPSQRAAWSNAFGGSRARRRSIAHAVTDNAEFRAFVDRVRATQSEAGKQQLLVAGMAGGVDLLSKDDLGDMLATMGAFYATTVTGGGATSAGPFIQNDLMPSFIAYARKRPTVAAIVGPGETDSDVVEYVEQSAPTDAAAETNEDTQASESSYAFATKTTNVQEITHFVPVTNRAIEDYGQIRTIIENELTLGVLDRLDTQLVSGNGSSPNLRGIYNTSGIGTQPTGGDTQLDALHKAVTQIRVAPGVLSEPDNIGMHPNDWQKVRLAKDVSGQYLMGPAGMAGDRQIWGVPVVVSTVFTEGQPLVGDFGGASRLWRRNALSVNTGLDGNDFTKRRVTMLAAVRVAFAVTRAGGFCTVTGF